VVSRQGISDVLHDELEDQEVTMMANQVKASIADPCVMVLQHHELVIIGRSSHYKLQNIPLVVDILYAKYIMNKYPVGYKFTTNVHLTLRKQRFPNPMLIIGMDANPVF
jgi:hypothetical protein